jgi:hypothetical protein
MHRLLGLTSLALAFGLTGCTCDKALARFWEVRDTTSNATCYTVDTNAVQAETIVTHYVTAQGTFVAPQRPVLVRQMSEKDWLAATGGAGYSLHYCPQRQACWASVSDR